MNRLPPELLAFIISYLPANEILKCKQINSEWRSIIDDNVRLKNLVITDLNLAFPKWSFTYRLVNCYDWIRQFYSIDDELIFKNLNQLYINGSSLFRSIYKLSDKLNDLNQLKKLEIIDLEVRPENFILNLPNLTHLALVRVDLDQITLNTPNLSYLKIRPKCYNNHFNFDLINFNYPLSVKILELNYFDSKVIKLSNLEYLYCGGIKTIDQNFLIKMPKLKEIHFNQHIYPFNRDLFQPLQRQKNQLKRDLKMYNLGLNLIYLSDIIDLCSMNYDEKADFLCKNYDKLAQIVLYISSINYNILEDRLVSIPVDFTSKFINIQLVSVDKKLANKRQFVEFLKGYKNLEELYLKNSSLNQKFINILPDLLPNLYNLEFYDKKKVFDFKPILKLKRLSSFETDQKLDLDFLNNLFKKTEVTLVEFKYRSKKLRVSLIEGEDEINEIDENSETHLIREICINVCESKLEEYGFIFGWNENFHEKFKKFERSNYWKNLKDYESDEEIDTDHESDDESIYDIDEIRYNYPNVINQFT